MTNSTARQCILTNQVHSPIQIINLINSPLDVQTMERMFSSLWRRYLMDKSATSTPYWADQFTTPQVFNRYVRHLSRSGWAISTVKPARNWAEIQLNEDKLLQYVSHEELNSIRLKYKFAHYRLKAIDGSEDGDRTKQGRTKLFTGLVRQGLAMSGSVPFKFDIPTLIKHRSVIELNLTKSMDKIIPDNDGILVDEANYKACSLDVLNHIITNPSYVYKAGTNINDSRGRAISDSLSKVFNPISNKDARSLLVLSPAQQFKPSGLRHVYLAIAELLGRKPTTLDQKEALGMHAYHNRAFHKLNLTLEDDRKDLHENIWLERLYNELDKYFTHLINSVGAFADRIIVKRLSTVTIQYATYASKPTKWHSSRAATIHTQLQETMDLIESSDIPTYGWTVVIEKDATASMLQVEGALLDHNPFLDLTNCTGSTLKDAWDLPGLPRNQYKKAITPLLYASSKSCKQLWLQAKMPYTTEQVRIFNKEITTGAMSVANLFKDFIVNNVVPKETMQVEIFNEVFTIKCNRYAHVGDYGVEYTIYDTKSNLVQSIHHTHTKNEPDLGQFKRYFVTLLIHNLDSRAADKVCFEELINPNGWVLPIHDAFLIGPMSADSIAESYCDFIDDIHTNRKSILKDYFRSIGITNSQATSLAWQKVSQHIQPTTDFRCQPSCLK